MREDILKIISQHEEATNVVVLTHNIHFVFVQTMVLASLRRSGHPTFTVFADAQCASDSYAQQAQVIDGLGTRYRVVPVEMSPGFRFHPKALLISGPTKGTLLVGSGNLTFGGWRENAEVWFKFDSDSRDLGPFAAFRQYLDRILDRIPIPEPVRAEIDEAFDAKTREWASGTGEPSGLLSRLGGPESLMDQISRVLQGEKAERLTVCSPYFDEEGEALATLIRRVGASRSRVLVQPRRTRLRESMLAGIRDTTELVTTDFQHTKGDGATRSAFIHAKCYAVDSEGQTTIFAGSANCSRAAMTISGPAGNAELMAVQRVPTVDFEGQFLGELIFKDETPALEEPAEIQDPDQSTEPDPIRILAARYDFGALHVGFSCAHNVKVTSSFVDHLRYDIEVLEPGLARIKLGHRPRVIELEGLLEGALIRSRASWVDHEYELRSTSRGRGLLDLFDRNIRPDAWDINAWNEIGDVFYRHLQYMPVRSAFGAGPGDKSTKPAKEIPEYTAEDVFSPTYAASRLSSYFMPLATNRDTRIRNLQQMLLNWFGVSVHDPEEEADTPGNGNDEDEVDKLEKLPEQMKRERRPVTDRDRRRAKRIFGKIAEAMTTEQFLEHRSPELLAFDLQIAAVLLRMGLSEAWITEEEFFETTHEIWKSLFFSCPRDVKVGWLQYRYESATSPSEFVERMSSAKLSAALVGWALAVHSGIETPEHARFVLSWILSIARLPWLWHGGSSADVAEALARMLQRTADWASEADAERSLKEAGDRWTAMMRRGHTLKALEAMLQGRSPADMKDHISQDEVAAGEILWQGDHGFCVSKLPCKRQRGSKATVYRLQGAEQEVRYQTDYLIPLRGLVSSVFVRSSLGISDDAKSELVSLLDELQGLL